MEKRAVKEISRDNICTHKYICNSFIPNKTKKDKSFLCYIKIDLSILKADADDEINVHGIQIGLYVWEE